jgi:hypothetical protein
MDYVADRWRAISGSARRMLLKCAGSISCRCAIRRNADSEAAAFERYEILAARRTLPKHDLKTERRRGVGPDEEQEIITVWLIPTRRRKRPGKLPNEPSPKGRL